MPILDFANRLLSAHEQLPSSLQEEGPEPALIRASTSGKRDARAITEAARLLDTYPAGTAAIITTDLEAVKLRSSCPRRDVPPGMIPIRFVTASSGAIRYSADSLTTLRATKDRTIATARDVMRRAVDDEGLTVGQAIQKYPTST